MFLRLRALAEEVLCLASKSEKIEIEEIQDKLKVPKETLNMIMDFLVKFGLADLDKERRYFRLSRACRKFFEETG